MVEHRETAMLGWGAGGGIEHGADHAAPAGGGAG